MRGARCPPPGRSVYELTSATATLAATLARVLIFFRTQIGKQNA
jgi:hypothetical protein